MSRKDLSKEILVREAALLVDQVGWANLSLSALADRVGVRSPSLYNHVRSLGDLRRELSLHAAGLLAEMVDEALRGKSGTDGLVAAGHAFRRLARERPGLHGALIRAPDADDLAMHDASRRALAPIFGLLQGMGIEGDAAIHAIRAIRSAVLGFTLLESSGGFGLPTDLEASFEWMIARLVPSPSRPQ